jgi:hypothetical protein
LPSPKASPPVLTHNLNLFIDQYGNMKTSSRKDSIMTLGLPNTSPKSEDMNQQSEMSQSKMPSPFNKNVKPVIYLPPHMREMKAESSKSSSRRESVSSSSQSVLKSAAKIIIEQSKASRGQQLESFFNYLAKYSVRIMEMLFKKPESDFVAFENAIWYNYLVAPKSSMIMKNSLLESVPLMKEVLNTWSNFEVCTFVKYTRPDLVHYGLSTFYSSISNLSFSRVDQNLGMIGQLNSLRKPIALITNKATNRINRTLEKLAQAHEAAFVIHRIKAESNVEQVMKVLDDFLTKKTWFVFDDIELMERSEAHQLLVCFTSLMMRQKTDIPSKFIILCKWKALPSMNRIEDSLYPEWISTCYKLVINKNASLREEMTDLYSGSVLTYNHSRSQSRISFGKSLNALNNEVNPDSRSKALLDSSHKSFNFSEDQPKPTAPLKTHSLNYLSEIMSFGVKKGAVSEYKATNKDRLEYCIKVYMGIVRQRKESVSILLSNRDVFVSLLPFDEDIQLIVRGTAFITRFARSAKRQEIEAQLLRIQIPARHSLSS